MPKIIIERHERNIISLHLCKNQTEAAKTANNLLLKFLRELGLSEDQIDDALECGDAEFCDDCGIAFRDGAWYCEQADLPPGKPGGFRLGAGVEEGFSCRTLLIKWRTTRLWGAAQSPFSRTKTLSLTLEVEHRNRHICCFHHSRVRRGMED